MVIATRTNIRNMALLVICQFEITFNWGQILKNLNFSEFSSLPWTKKSQNFTTELWLCCNVVHQLTKCRVSVIFTLFDHQRPHKPQRKPANIQRTYFLLPHSLFNSFSPDFNTLSRFSFRFVPQQSIMFLIFFVRTNAWTMMVGWLEILYQTTRPRSIGKHTVSLNFQKSTSFSLPKNCVYECNDGEFWEVSYFGVGVLTKWRRDGSVYREDKERSFTWGLSRYLVFYVELYNGQLWKSVDRWAKLQGGPISGLSIWYFFVHRGL